MIASLYQRMILLIGKPIWESFDSDTGWLNAHTRSAILNAANDSYDSLKHFTPVIRLSPPDGEFQPLQLTN